MGKAIWLATNITFDCNKDCCFCYAKRESSGPMSGAVMNKLMQRYREHVEKYGFNPHTIIVALGGEPLLYEDVTREYFVKVREVTPEVQFKDLFTNGLLLTEDFVKWTKEERVVITLSANDTPLDVLEDRMKLISKHRKYAVHSIVLAYQNLIRLNELIDLCAKYRLQPRLRHVYMGGSIQRYIEDYDRIVPEAVQRILDKGYLFYPHFFFEMTAPFWDRPFFAHSCGSRYFLTDPDGKVRVCPTRPESIGNLFDEGFEFIWNMKASSCPSFRPDRIEECEKCEFRNLCGGGCLATKIAAFGTHLRPSPFCKTFKKVFPMVLEMKDRWLKNQRGVRF